MAHGLKIIAAALVLVVALGSPVWAQNDRQFASDAGLLFNPIRPSKTADFERVVGRIRMHYCRAAIRLGSNRLKAGRSSVRLG